MTPVRMLASYTDGGLGYLQAIEVHGMEEPEAIRYVERWYDPDVRGGAAAKAEDGKILLLLSSDPGLGEAAELLFRLWGALTAVVRFNKSGLMTGTELCRS